MVPFRYGEFWDVPRYIVLHYRGWLFYLESLFNDELDDYEETYSVYRLPDSVEIPVKGGSWHFREDPRLTLVGKIEVKSVIFDDRKREELDASVLDPFTGAEELGG